MIAFLVSVLFLLMMTAEITCQLVTGWLADRRGRSLDEKNPAEIVGTFKRYK